MHRVGAADVHDAGLGQTEKSHPALFDQFTDRAGDLLDRHRAIDAMLIEQVDVVGAKAAQASLDRATDILGPAVRADDPVALEARATLRRDHYLMAPASNARPSNSSLAKGAIVLGGLLDEWIFGDGVELFLLARPYMLHVYQRPGTYTCELGLINEQGIITTVFATITVKPAG